MQSTYDKAWMVKMVKREERQQLKSSFEGPWLCRWPSGQEERLIVENDSFTVFGIRYSFSDEEGMRFYWPDGTRQHAVTTERNSSIDRTVHVIWAATNSNGGITWDRIHAIV